MKTRIDKEEGGRCPPLEKLLGAGLRPTRQRLLLAKILWDGLPKHVTAEEVRLAVRKRRGKVSLATVYNALNQFTKAGLLRAVSASGAITHFDTTLTPHHHFFDEVSGRLWDIPDGDFRIAALPAPPAGRRIERVDVVVRLGKSIKGNEK